MIIIHYKRKYQNVLNNKYLIRVYFSLKYQHYYFDMKNACYSLSFIQIFHYVYKYIHF